MTLTTIFIITGCSIIGLLALAVLFYYFWKNCYGEDKTIVDRDSLNQDSSINEDNKSLNKGKKTSAKSSEIQSTRSEAKTEELIIKSNHINQETQKLILIINLEKINITDPNEKISNIKLSYIKDNSSQLKNIDFEKSKKLELELNEKTTCWDILTKLQVTAVKFHPKITKILVKYPDKAHYYQFPEDKTNTIFFKSFLQGCLSQHFSQFNLSTDKNRQSCKLTLIIDNSVSYDFNPKETTYEVVFNKIHELLYNKYYKNLPSSKGYKKKNITITDGTITEELTNSNDEYDTFNDFLDEFLGEEDTEYNVKTR